MVKTSLSDTDCSEKRPSNTLLYNIYNNLGRFVQLYVSQLNLGFSN